MKMYRLIITLAAFLALACAGHRLVSPTDDCRQKLGLARTLFDGGKYEEGRQLLQALRERCNNNPQLEHLLGLTYARLGGVVNRAFAMRHLKKAIRLAPDSTEWKYELGKVLVEAKMKIPAYLKYKEVLAADSTHLGACLGILQLCFDRFVSNGDFAKLEEGLALGRNALKFHSANIPLIYQVAMLATLQEKYDQAEKLLKSAVRPDTLEAELTLLEAYLRYKQHKFVESMSLFNHGLAILSEESRQGYYDLGLLLSPLDKKSYERLPDDRKIAFADSVWKSLDPDPTTALNEKIVEHYARVYFSELLFSYPPLHKHGWDTDQGRLWIRYGQPLAGRQISASDDFMEAENLLDPLKYNRRWQWTFLINGRLETLTFVDLIGNGYIRLTPIGEGYSDFKAFELALETPQQVAREWTAQPIQVFRAPFVARGGNGKAELTLFLAVPYDQFSYTNERGHAVCQVGCRLAAIDRRGTTTFCDSQSNKLIISPTLSLNPDFYHAFKLQAQLPADSLMLAWAVEQIDAGKITIQKMPLETYDFADKGFHMSSLLLLSRAGEAEQGSIFNRRGRKLIPNFTGNFTSGDTLRVYYEIEDLPTNLRGRTRYRFSYAIEELSTSRGLIASLAGFLATRQPHRITHSEEKGDIRTEINEYLNIPLADLPAGRYRFTLEIEELIIGKTLSRAADFSIINAQDKP